MFKYVATSFGVLVLGQLTHAMVTPTTPGPGSVYKVGSACPIAWTVDTTGTWTSFSIDLMSGSNLAMQTVTNVAKNLDGTKAISQDFICPDVTPYSAIYFYQFTQITPSGPNTTWTTRFTIASANGDTTPPANPKQPEGSAIPWGVGKLTSGAAPTTAPVANVTASTSPAANSSSVPASMDPSMTNANSSASVNNSSNSTGVLTRSGVAVTGNPPQASNRGTGAATTAAITSPKNSSTSTAASAGTTSGCASLVPHAATLTSGLLAVLCLYVM